MREKSLRYFWGGYPEVCLQGNLKKREILLKEIIRTYIQKDIVDFLNVGNISAFNNLISLLSHQVGNLLNKVEVCNTLGIHFKTLENYLDILKGTFIFSFLKPFYTNIRKELSKMPKIYAEDMGIIRHCTGRSFTDFKIIRENIEYLITLLDIHTEYSAMFKFKQLGVDWDPYPFIPLDYTSRDEMKKIRSHLAIYLFLCLSNLEDEDGVLEKFFRERLRPDDHLITFNYDLLIEKALWKIGQWSPVKGCVEVEQLEYKKDEEELIEAGWDRSPHKILKLHGSINWKYEDALSTNVKEDAVVTLDNLEKWDFFFPEKLRKILNREPAQPTGIEERLISKGYAGSYSPLPWILPSYVKVFSKASFLINIWKETQRILAETKRLVVLGYSFPEVDSQSQLLLASLPDDCSILIVDPDADAIKMRMDKLFQFPDISVQKMEFEKWVQQGCPGLK